MKTTTNLTRGRKSTILPTMITDLRPIKTTMEKTNHTPDATAAICQIERKTSTTYSNPHTWKAPQTSPPVGASEEHTATVVTKHTPDATRAPSRAKEYDTTFTTELPMLPHHGQTRGGPRLQSGHQYRAHSVAVVHPEPAPARAPQDTMDGIQLHGDHHSPRQQHENHTQSGQRTSPGKTSY